MHIKRIFSLGLLCALVASVGGCLTLSGDYRVTAVDAAGKPILENIQLMAHGSGIYTSINAICASYPKATVHITDIHTGEELKSESPHQCR